MYRLLVVIGDITTLHTNVGLIHFYKFNYSSRLILPGGQPSAFVYGREDITHFIAVATLRGHLNGASHINLPHVEYIS